MVSFDLPSPAPNTVGTPMEISPHITKGTYFFDTGFFESSKGEAPAVVYGGIEDCAPDYWVDRVGFAHTALEFVVAGQGKVEMDGRHHELGPGAVFCYGPETHVRIRTEPNWVLKKYFVCLRGDGLAEALQTAGLGQGMMRWLAEPFEIQRVWDQLISEGRSLRPGREAICAAQLHLLFVKLAHMPDAGSATNPTRSGAESTFRRCRGFVDEHAAQVSSVSEITRATGVTRAHLSRLFRRFQGESPYQYLVRRKMSLAAERLAAGDCLVKEAARVVGMADPYHFSRLFKNVYRLAPSEFCRRLGRG